MCDPSWFREAQAICLGMNLLLVNIVGRHFEICIGY